MYSACSDCVELNLNDLPNPYDPEDAPEEGEWDEDTEPEESEEPMRDRRWVLAVVAAAALLLAGFLLGIVLQGRA